MRTNTYTHQCIRLPWGYCVLRVYAIYTMYSIYKMLSCIIRFFETIYFKRTKRQFVV